MTAYLEAQVAEPTAASAVPYPAPAPLAAPILGGHARQPLTQQLRDRVRSVYPK